MKSIIESFKRSKGENFAQSTTHKSLRIKGDIFERLGSIAITQGLTATALANMLLANFVAEVDSQEQQKETKKPYHNPEFDPDDEPFKGVI